MTNLLHVTDQVRCYDPLGNEISCRNSGQDASQKWSDKSLIASNSRFQSKNSVVTDSLTGHIWAQNANPGEYPLSWQEAHEFIEALNKKEYSGFSSWRMPDRRALFSLLSHQFINPALPMGHPFENIFPGYYWTCDTCKRLPDQAWYVHMGGGRVFRGMKHGAYLTWPVIQKAQNEKQTGKRFSTKPPLVFDHENQSSWLVETNSCLEALTWHDALQNIQDLNRKQAFGSTGWRLPNIRELESVVDVKTHSPAIFSALRDINIAPGYWSSTTSVYEPRYAWVLYTRDGEIGVGFKQRADFFRLAVTDTII
jgi:hypothetical protein